MLSGKLITIALAIYLVIIEASGSAVKCQGEIKNGKLTLTEEGVSKITGSNHASVAETCTILRIDFNTEESARVDWNEIEKPTMPKLYFLVHSFTNPKVTTESEYIRDLSWKNLSIFGHEPEEVARLGYCIMVDLGYGTMDYDNIFEFSPVVNIFKISGLDPHPFLNKFKDQNILINTLTIKKNKLDDNLARFKIPDGIEHLVLEDVEIKNLTGFIGKLESLEILSLDLNLNEKLDLSEILKVASKNLTVLDIWHSNLTFNDVIVQSKSLKSLDIMDCTLDSTFMKDTWRSMPALESLRLELMSTNFDISDLSLNKHLSKLDIRNTKVTFTESSGKFLAMKTLNFEDCEFDSNFVVNGMSAFPNLEHVSGVPPGWN